MGSTLVRVRCNSHNCGREVLIPLGGNVSIPPNCLHCGGAWHNANLRYLSDLIASINHFRSTQGGLMDVVFEMKVDDQAQI